MQIEMTPIEQIAPAPYNPRTITDRELAGLKESIKKFGLVDPLIVNKRSGVLCGGHQRLKAAESLGHTEVPVVYVDLDKSEEKALNVALNAHTIQGKFDLEVLPTVLEEIKLDLPELHVDLNLEQLAKDLQIDFNPEVESKEGLIDDDEVPEPTETKVKRGEIWQLGEHRLMCGDSTKAEDVERLMGGEKADMVFTDPPYGINIKNTKGAIRGDGDLAVFSLSIQLIKDVLSDSAHVYIYFGIQKLKECITLLTEQFNQTNLLIQRVTHENKPSPSGMFKNNYEVCFFSNIGGRKFNEGVLNVSSTTLNDTRYTGNGKLKTYCALSEIKCTEHNLKSIHPTQKTVAICEFYQKVSTKKNELVLDLFLGSGSTLIACEKTNRKCYGMELDEHYCDVIISRWEQFTGKKATKVD